MSDYEEDSTDIQNLSKTLSAESLVGPYRANTTDQWTASNRFTVKIPPLIDASTSWFKYEELIDGKRGPALKNRLVGDTKERTS